MVQSRNNLKRNKMATKKKADSYTSYAMYGKKMKSGGKTSFGMLSVKAGVDKNPNPTAADRIAGAKMNAGKAQAGRTINKMRTKGSDPLSEYSPKIRRGSGNLIPVGAKKNPVTGRPLRKKMGGTVGKSLGTYGKQIGKNYSGKARGGMKMGKCRGGC